ncbi:MAG: DUF2484 family protein [Paracoccaceae bacterium]
MIWPMIAGLLWLIAANVIAMFPSRDHHWRNAYGLIAVGIPILGWITWINGPLLGLLFLAGGASILRWPVYFLWRWARGLVGKGQAR